MGSRPLWSACRRGREQERSSAEHRHRACARCSPAHRHARRADRSARPTDWRPLARGRDGPAPDEHSWPRPDLRDSAGGVGTAARDLCQGTISWPGSASPRGRTPPLADAARQGAARAYFEDGAAGPKAAADHRRNGHRGGDIRSGRRRKSPVAKSGLDEIALIYAIEDKARCAPPAERLAHRTAIIPLLDAFFARAETTERKLSARSGLAEAALHDQAPDRR